MANADVMLDNKITKFTNKKGNDKSVYNEDVRSEIKKWIEDRRDMELLKSMEQGEKNPTEFLNEMGFSLKDITGGLKDHVDMYKGMVEQEQQRRGEIEEREREARERMYEMRENFMQQTLNQQMDSYKKSMEEMMKKFEENKGSKEQDPFSQMSNQMMMELLKEKMEEVKNPNQQNPLEQIFGAAEMYEQLKEKFKPSDEELPKKLDNHNLELFKLKLEDERLRTIEERKIEMDTKKHDTIKYAVNTFGAELVDALSAFAGAFTSYKGQNPNTQTEPPQQPAQAQQPQAFPYFCEGCGETFYLARQVENPVCPYCQHGGDKEQNYEENNEQVGE